MVFLMVLVFLVVFAACAAILLAGGSAAAGESKQALARLQSTLASNRRGTRDEIVDLRKQELLSAVPWINRWLAQLELAPRVRLILYQANLKWTTGGLMLMCLACFVFTAYLIYLRSGVAVLSMLLGLLAGGAPIVFVMAKRRQRFNQFEQGLPEAIDLMVSALRAGHSLASSLGLVSRESPAPIGPEFKICYDEQNFGLELRTAMENLVTRMPLQDLRIVTVAILIQKESGGNLAEVLDKTSHVIRERFRLKRQIRVHTAQGRLTGWILTFLPLVLGLLLYLVNPKTMSVLWTRDIGIKLMYASAVMTFIGGLIIRKIVNMEV
jgi:tight adherence protein B